PDLRDLVGELVGRLLGPLDELGQAIAMELDRLLLGFLRLLLQVVLVKELYRTGEDFGGGVDGALLGVGEYFDTCLEDIDGELQQLVMVLRLGAELGGLVLQILRIKLLLGRIPLRLGGLELADEIVVENTLELAELLVGVRMLGPVDRFVGGGLRDL